MNESEKERLIKKDIVSIENRVRHAFNQGYEMGMKESCSEIPNTCGDAISRQEAIDKMQELEDEDIKAYSCKIPEGFDGKRAIEALKALQPVTPQQRLGRWITSHIPESVLCECSECGFTCGAYSFNYCPNCGARMEAEE